MRRREFLTLSATSIGGILVSSLDRKPFRLFAPSEQSVRIQLRFFTQPEALIVAAAASRIFPSDETGPGAQEAGVAVYIDRQLAGPWGRDRYRYTQEPFEENAPAEFGYQGKATPRQVYREGLKDLKGFDQLPPAEQDNKLRQIETTVFFSLLRRNTIEIFEESIPTGVMPPGRSIEPPYFESNATIGDTAVILSAITLATS
jgi:hypothetical protein